MYSVNWSQMLETAYGTCCLPMHRQQAECDLTPGALSEPHNMQLYHPYSGRGRPRRRQSSCCGRGSSVSSAHWQRKWLSFCLPAPTGSRNGVKNDICADKCARLYSLMHGRVVVINNLQQPRRGRQKTKHNLKNIKPLFRKALLVKSINKYWQTNQTYKTQ